MRKLLLLVFATFMLLETLSSQTDSTGHYKDLAVLKYYRVAHLIENHKVKTYSANGKEVSEATFNKFQSSRENINLCKPCILEEYDENDVLIRQAARYSDIYIGFYKEFYPNGKIKKEGLYNEKNIEEWEDLIKQGLCCKKTGKWIFYSENGDTLYSEFWKNGEFIKQVPEQKTNEIWTVDFTLDGVSIKNQTINSKQMSQIKITPKYKNSSKMNNNFIVKLVAYNKEGMAIEKSCLIDGLSRIEFDKILEEAKVQKNETLKFQISVFNHNKIIAYQDVLVIK